MEEHVRPSFLSDKDAGCGMVFETIGESEPEYGKWEVDNPSKHTGRGWCVCLDPTKQGISYARKVAKRLGWRVLKGESPGDMEKEKQRPYKPPGIDVSVEGYKALYHQDEAIFPVNNEAWGQHVVQFKWQKACEATVNAALATSGQPFSAVATITFPKPFVVTLKVDCKDDKNKNYTDKVLDSLAALGWELALSPPPQ